MAMSAYFFYILYSEKADKYYIGHTSETDGRLRRHLTHHKGFTGKIDDWKLVYQEQYESKELAYERERQIKKWKNRKRIEALINKQDNQLN